jgi:2-hydroxychromene-2-carboxylate isomerase
LDADLKGERQGLKAVVEVNQKELTAAGHWGVPTCVFAGDPFFGQDCLDVLL